MHTVHFPKWSEDYIAGVMGVIFDTERYSEFKDKGELEYVEDVIDSFFDSLNLDKLS